MARQNTDALYGRLLFPQTRNTPRFSTQDFRWTIFKLARFWVESSFEWLMAAGLQYGGCYRPLASICGDLENSYHSVAAMKPALRVGPC
jgi:hypothetical protein